MADKTHSKHARVYVGGYDLSGYTATIGPLSVEFEGDQEAVLTSGVKALLGGFGQATVSPGTLSGLFDNTATSGLHALHSVPGSAQIVTVAVGSQAAPAAGDPIFCCSVGQRTYLADAALGGAALPATIEFGMADGQAANLKYPVAWGRLLHASSAVTAVNGGTANHDHGASTAFGGIGFLHVLAGNGTATFTIEHSATNTDGAFDSTGAVITFATTAADTPFAEIKATATPTTTIQRYTRWQVALGTATSVTFVMGLLRGIG